MNIETKKIFEKRILEESHLTDRGIYFAELKCLLDQAYEGRTSALISLCCRMDLTVKEGLNYLFEKSNGPINMYFSSGANCNLNNLESTFTSYLDGNPRNVLNLVGEVSVNNKLFHFKKNVENKTKSLNLTDVEFLDRNDCFYLSTNVGYFKNGVIGFDPKTVNDLNRSFYKFLE